MQTNTENTCTSEESRFPKSRTLTVWNRVAKSNMQCAACGHGIPKDHWYTIVNGNPVHDNGVCAEVWKCNHGFPYSKFAVSMGIR